MRRTTLIVGSCVIFALSILVILIVYAVKENQFKNKLLADFMYIQKIDKTKEEDCKRDYIDKCLLARQVYQWSWYSKTKTKIGDLQLEKWYAMDLFQYNELIEQSWKYNRILNIPLDSWENYIMLAKWIVESGINEWAQHKTGEIIKFAGYTEEGMIGSLFYYRYESHIGKGHPFYIPELFRDNIDREDLINVFKNIDNVVKYDYAFIHYLLERYDYQWNWVLTAFHFGMDKTEYWNEIGLKDIPNYRMDGHWSEEYLRKYYQAIYEIAQGIARGYLGRISKYEEIVGAIKKLNDRERKYIDTLRLKVRSQQAFDHLEKKYMMLQEDFTNYKKLNTSLLKSMAELNDINLDKENPTLRSRMRELKNNIKKMWLSIRRNQ
jgi:hypothetical protein